MIKEFIKKVLLLSGIKTNKSKSNIFSSAVFVPESSIFIGGLDIRFDNGMNERIYVTIGERCLIKCSFVFESTSGMISIGNNVHIGGATMISKSSIIVKDDVTMAWGITIYDHNSHSIFWDKRKNDNAQCYEDYHNHMGNNVVNKNWSNVLTKAILIESKVWIGFGVTVLKGVTIGEGAVIGAMSVVTKDVPAWSVAAGNPAVVVKRINQ